ncbi:MAG: mandelate racemase/muconate lactonizing enzyme family protein [Prolixibacteraceae bacterium]|nr:mandelate racemase/muconate lactonizing enzyme family protein [Prolixibacteraceae bacterium]
MKIQKIEPFVVNQNLKEPFHFSQWEYQSRTICLVKVTTDDGVYGWGEGYGPANLVKAGIEFFNQFIIGMNALDHEVVWQQMYLRSLDYARRGVMLAALSAIDIALWDIKGKHYQLPVSTLLGGRKNEFVKPYATGLYFSNGKDLKEKLVEEALLYKQQGFKGIKMKVGLGIAKDVEYIIAIKNAIGNDVELMIDSNHAYSLKEAQQLCIKLKEVDISWFEEPVSPEHYDGYRQLRENTSIPIAGGECEYLRYGFLQLFQNKSIDIAQPDICAAGGITETKRIATMANTFGVEVVPHSWGTGVALHAAMHFISNLDSNPGRMYDSVPWMELDRTENALRDIMVEPLITQENGYLKVPTRPGLGVEVNEEMLEKFLEKE